MLLQYVEKKRKKKLAKLYIIIILEKNDNES